MMATFAYDYYCKSDLLIASVDSSQFYPSFACDQFFQWLILQLHTVHFVNRGEVSFKSGTFTREKCNYWHYFKRYYNNFAQKGAILSAWHSKASLCDKMLKKVPKVAVLRPICSELGRDFVYSNEMHSELDRCFRWSVSLWFYFSERQSAHFEVEKTYQ